MHALRNGILVGLDMDGVIIDHTENKIALAKEIGFVIHPDDTPSDTIRKLIPEQFLNTFWDALYNNPKTALDAKLMSGVEDGLELLQNKRIPFVLISRRKDPFVAAELLKARGLWPRFFRDDNAFFVQEIEDKNTIAQARGVTHYVDDDIQVLDVLHDVRNRFLFDPQANFPASSGYLRVSSWPELTDHFSL